MRCGADDLTIGGHPVRGCLGDGHDDRGARCCPGGRLPGHSAGRDRRNRLVAHDRQRPAEYQPWFRILDCVLESRAEVAVPLDSRWMAGMHSFVAARRRVEPGATFDNGK